MEIAIIGLYSWILIQSLVLIFCPKERIPLMIRFFERVIPTLPVTSIIKALKEMKKK